MNNGNFWIWVCYLVGMFSVLLIKYARYLYRQSEAGTLAEKGWQKITLSWIFGGTSPQAGAQTPISWVTTLGIAGLVGGFVVGGYFISIFPDEQEKYVNIHWFAFTIGSLIEMIAPPMSKFIVGGITRIFNKQ